MLFEKYIKKVKENKCGLKKIDAQLLIRIRYFCYVMLCSFPRSKNDIPANISDQQFISLNICTTCTLYAFITFIISLCITPIKLIKSLLYYFSTFHQVNFTNVLLFKSAIYVFSVTSTEKFPELSKLYCLT